MEENKVNDLSGTPVKKDAREKMLSGSAWMTAGSITSRILGAIYIIPWVTWFGTYSNEANALFAQGYNIYSYFLVIATAGIPSAISKLVAHYNGINEYGVSRRLYHSGMYVSMAMGMICAIIMLFGASLMDNGDPNVIPVIQSLAWAVLIIPAMSITRGFLQGYNWMAPSAMSQFVEQLFRVVYMLLATYYIMKIKHGSWVSAVTQSTFAAFVGAIGAIIVLVIAWMRHLNEMNDLVQHSVSNTEVSTTSLIFKIVYQSIPFIIIEGGINLYQLIDQYTFPRMMSMVGHFSHYQVTVLYALFSFNANKLYMIVISLASAMAATVIPLLATARAQNDHEGMRKQIQNVLLLFYFVMIPAALGLSAVSQQIYTVFYRYDAAGVVVLQVSAYISILLGLYTVGAAMMQGISENKRMMTFLGIGVIVKFIVQFPCIWIFEGVGPLVATGISMFVVNYLILHSFNMEFTLRFDKMAVPTNQILAYSLVMFAGTKIVMLVISHFVSPYGRYTAFFSLIPGVLVGVGIYLYLCLKSRLADQLLGPRVERLRTILHIK
ncbi:oligosaccharide flippase family protein [Limosilactobacillus albertensis]|uniref:Oligosaccharide flippase family protein n=1 Tax=Limosilactobacillus albertensis TaxID=2759752 RepID=A0A839HB65_9LACO|nr:oligosaccharide flippase family protein [Limosilactobacillus albertensis]MBB1124407.1 oligosaccharide flippase family protein [Limosilactobacillus albertensis]MCD7121085.1 oligosaccharide flippase family protein [Limosilactobacillus albertensis]